MCIKIFYKKFEKGKKAGSIVSIPFNNQRQRERESKKSFTKPTSIIYKNTAATKSIFKTLYTV